MNNYRVSHYKRITYNHKSKKLTEQILPFTEIQAKEIGGVLESDGLNIALAIKLCQKWAVQGKSESISYAYSIIDKTGN